jgi:hypothetical protein
MQPLLKPVGDFDFENAPRDSEVESRHFRLRPLIPRPASCRERVVHLPKNSRPLDFGFHFPA